MAWLMVVTTICLIGGASLAVTPTEDFPHSIPLTVSDVYHLFWKYDENTITFEVHVKTHGYVGFGISQMGGMKDADIVIGWVKNGVSYLEDRYAEREAVPKLDESQDWKLLKGEENDTHTILSFWRKLKTCDERDVEISNDTTKLIWAYNDWEPGSPGQDPRYHGAKQRGTRTMFLINPPSTRAKAMPNDTISLDLFNRNYTVPNKATTYHCQAFSVPKLDVKHHILMVEPVIQPGNEAAVHHMVLYGCFHELDTKKYPAYTKWDDAHGLTGECYVQNMPTDACRTYLFAWAIGGGNHYFPEHVGYPLGGLDEKLLLMRLEIHYDNPELRNDIVDSSGMRLWLSPTLRDNEVGILIVGVKINTRHVIPPKFSSMKSIGYCSGSCERMMENNERQFNVVSVGLHTHLAGTAVRLRHFRDGVEQPVITRDEHYDFNFQDYRMFDKEIPIAEKDDIILECEYSTTERTNITWGGLATLDEMCYSFLMYYPLMSLNFCGSSPTMDQTVSYLPAKTKNLTLSEFTNLIETTDWTQATTREQFQQAVVSGNVDAYCEYKTPRLKEFPSQIPDYVKPLPPISHVTCEPAGSHGNTLMLTWTVYMASIVLSVV